VIAALAPAVVSGTTLYSDLGFILLGAVVERVTGRTLDRLFDERIARPLALSRTGFAVEPRRFPDAAATERGNGYERRLAGPDAPPAAFRQDIPRGEVHDGNAHALGGVSGHAGLFGTVGEVTTLLREILEPARLPLSPGSRRKLLEPVAGPGSRSFGFVMARDSQAASGVLPDDAPGHTGFTGTSIWLDPGASATFVLLTNRVHPVVPPHDFQPVRRGFHRMAKDLLERRR
jgi:CubicO group peptidase (beta-lactamase class C family)